MKDEDIVSVLEYISKNRKLKKRKELSYSIALLIEKIKNERNSINSKCESAKQNGNLALYEKLKRHCDVLNEVCKRLADYKKILEVEEHNVSTKTKKKSNWVTGRHGINEEYKNVKIYSFVFLGRRYSVKNWKDMLLKICEILYEIDSTMMKSFADNERLKGNKLYPFTFKPKDNSTRSEKYALIKGTSLYVLVNNDTYHKMQIIKKILPYYNLSEDSIEIFIYK